MLDGSLRPAVSLVWPARYLHRLLYYQRVGVPYRYEPIGRFLPRGRFAVSGVGVPGIRAVGCLLIRYYQVSAIGAGGFTVNIKCRRIGNSSVLSIGSQADPLHLRVRGIK